MKLFTIEDLANGKCAVINDGNKEELQKVLKAAYKNTYCAYGGIDGVNYYWTDNDYYWKNSNTNYNKLPTQSVKDFLKQLDKETFVLPEKWYVLRTFDNAKVLNDWFNIYSTIDIKWSGNNGWMNYPKTYNKSINPNEQTLLEEKYTEITFEQFKQYILKENTMKEQFPIDKFPIDNFAVVIENNAKEIVDYLVSKGFDNIHDFTGSQKNDNHYQVINGKIDVGWYTKNPKYTLQQLKQLDTMEQKILFQVKCITKEFSFIKYGEIYNVIKENEHSYKIKETEGTYNKDKFERMEQKKQIGWKLIKKEYQDAALKICRVSLFSTLTPNVDFIVNSLCESKLKEAGVLELWFEPVFKEVPQFKENDWVIGWHCNDSGVYPFSTKAWKFGNIVNGIYVVPKDYADCSTGIVNIRLATPEEIETATTEVIKMYSSNKGEFEIEVVNKKAYYRPDKKELPKYFIEEIIDWYDDSTKTYSPYSLKVQSLTVGCMEGTRKEDWLKVLAEMIK